MAESTGVFASLRVPPQDGADTRSPAADGTLISADVAVFPAVSRDVLERTTSGDVLLASEGAAESAAIELISAYGAEDATVLSVVVKLAGTDRDRAAPANAVTGQQLQKALEAGDGDIGVALEQLGLSPAAVPVDLAGLSDRTGAAVDAAPVDLRAQRVHRFTEIADFGWFSMCWLTRSC